MDSLTQDCKGSKSIEVYDRIGQPNPTAVSMSTRHVRASALQPASVSVYYTRCNWNAVKGLPCATSLPIHHDDEQHCTSSSHTSILTNLVLCQQTAAMKNVALHPRSGLFFLSDTSPGSRCTITSFWWRLIGMQRRMQPWNKIEGSLLEKQ